MGRRRGSIFFGVFLLVIGVIFLLGQFLPINIWAIFWPAFLIFLGLWLLFGRNLFRRTVGASGEKVVSFAPDSGGMPAASMHPASSAVASDNVAVGAFNRVQHKSMGNLTLVQGDHEELVIEAPEAIRDRIRTEVKNSTLFIYFDHDWWDWFDFGWWGSNRIEYRLTMREIAGLNMSGAGNLNGSAIKTSKLELEHSGAGNITIDNLEAEQITVRQHGAGNTSLSGQVADQDVVLSGAGNYRAADLQTHSARMTLSGVGNATIWVSDTLDVKMSGVGNVEYYGSPSVNQHLSGVGNLRSLGNR